MIDPAIKLQHAIDLAKIRLCLEIAKQGIQRGEVKLASGASSDHYFDLRPLLMQPKLLGNFGLLVFDMQSASIPLTVAALSMPGGAACFLEGFWVREAAKGHGMGRMIEGCDVKDRRVLLVDDVLTSGGSLATAASAVREAGGAVVAAYVIVDRQAGGREILESMGIAVESAFVASDFIENPSSKDEEAAFRPGTPMSQEEFTRLVDAWYDNAPPSSDPRVLMAMPQFRRVAELGEAGLPLLLREIDRRPGLIVWAAPHMRPDDADPVPREDWGKIDRMCRSWVEWGKRTGVIS
jgi:orotate phosphoribosyltransferase